MKELYSTIRRLALSVALCGVTLVMNGQEVVSPNGKLSAKVQFLTPDAQHSFLQLNYNGQQVLELADIPFDKLSFVRKLKDDYRMLSGKRLHCTNEANEYEAAIGANAKIVMRLYNDGIAFRYEYTGLKEEKHPKEQTSYVIPEGTRRWMMQWSDGYEGFYPLSTTANVKKFKDTSGSKVSEDINTHWGYPLLMEATDGVFALITEANIERRQSASSLFTNQLSSPEVFNVVQDENDLLLSGDWHTPWRVVIIGTLADIVQSTLVTDVSEPSRLADTSWICPGVVSWIYWAYNHGSNDYNIIKKYVDMAATLKLPYVLIDAEWDEMDKVASNEGKTIEDAVAYARSKGVKPMIWYNSSVGWLDGAPGPKFRLNKAEDREKEFAWCEKIGVAGVKIDFFSGDNQMNMDYCQDLLESAARHHLLVNFHGAPIPRGWQRTYPNLLSTEGVYGAEWYNNVPHFTKKAACHNATLPFTRNVVGPMDYTPCAFSDSQHPHITSKAHELALTVLYESGLQHLADRPESFLAQPQEVQAFLGQLPTVWDETRYVSGYPGESVVLARRSGDTWYVAGINGKDEVQTLSVPIDFITPQSPLPSGGVGGGYLLFTDDASGEWKISTVSDLPSQMVCQPRGGFVLVGRKLVPVQKKSFKVTKELPITSVKNQYRSGTCWDYATLGFLESEILRKTGKTYDLCEMFVVNKDYMDCATHYVRMHGFSQISEGGSCDDVVEVIRQHGICPENAMPAPGSLTGDSLANFKVFFPELERTVSGIVWSEGKPELNRFTTEAQAPLRNKAPKPHWQDSVQAVIEKYVGRCPESFVYEGKAYSPKSFAESLGLNMDDYVSLTSYTHHPFNEWFVIEAPYKWRLKPSYNIPIEQLMEVLDRALDAGYTVAWGGDVSGDFLRKEGLAMLPDGIVPTQEMRQEQWDDWRFTYDHVMLIYGKAVDEAGKPYYLVKNSWGESGPYKGIWYMSRDYIALNTTYLFLNRNALPKKLRKVIGDR